MMGNSGVLLCLATAVLASAYDGVTDAQRVSLPTGGRYDNKPDDISLSWLADEPAICALTDPAISGDHVAAIPCDSLATASQAFTLTGEGKFELTANKNLCLTVGKDDDPSSGTSSVDMDVCSKEADDAQIFSYNKTIGHIVHKASGRCIDLDGSDHRAELYGCNEPVSPNQQWNYTDGAIKSDQMGWCLSSCRGVKAGALDDVTSASVGESEANFTTASKAELRIIFLRDDMVRVWLAPQGAYINPAGDEIVINTNFPTPTVAYKELTDTYELSTSKLKFVVTKSPLKLELQDSAGKTLFQESEPITWNTTATWQTLDQDKDEYFYGGGMQCGYFSHKGKAILIKEGGGWKTGGRPNPVPFYMSTNGYGVYRNTYTPGQYNFLSPGKFAHNEYRFDAFYFVGSLKEILTAYTDITGKPPMLPVWGIHLGDSDCYNQKNRSTTDVIAIADGYRENDMPGGWLIPNDGYGCGYTQLDYVIEQLHKRGFYTALWTSTGLANATWEIGTAGSRGIKTDVGWVGNGYKFELDALKLATGLLEDNSNTRRFIYTVCGWAGSHHYAVMWNGDNYGGYDYLDFQVPTVLGSGLSAQAYTTGDVDGIFGGSPETYTRDLQWKTFLTVFMTMSGWAKYDKQPWRYGEPYTTYNRAALKLKVRLTPYQYSYARIANLTGIPPARALVLEYPDDPMTWDNTTSHQFLSGEWFLVAPVYTNSTTRDGIYLPEGEWIEYWHGKRYPGKQTLNNHSAPLNELPLFVKAGAVIPMWPAMNYFNEKPHDPITLDCYVSAHQDDDTTFVLYEDDGLTRNFTAGAWAEQDLKMTSDQSKKAVTINVGMSKGPTTYVGKPSARGYVVQLHSELSFEKASLADKSLTKLTTKANWEKAHTGWFQDSKTGITYVKTGSQPLDSEFTLAFSS